MLKSEKELKRLTRNSKPQNITKLQNHDETV